MKKISSGVKQWYEEGDSSTPIVLVDILQRLESKGLDSVKVLKKSVKKKTKDKNFLCEPENKSKVDEYSSLKAENKFNEKNYNDDKYCFNDAKLNYVRNNKSEDHSDDHSDGHSDDNNNKEDDEESSDDDDSDDDSSKVDNSDDDDSDDDDDDDDDVDDNSDDDDEDEDDDDENSDKNNNNDEDSDDSSSENYDSSDESDILEVKVRISPSGDVHYFRSMAANLFRKFSRRLKKTYNSKMKMYYKDSEGDNIIIQNNKDFRQAVKIHRSTAHGSVMRLQADLLGSNNLNELAYQESNGTSIANSATSEGTVLWQRGDVIGRGSFGEVYNGLDLLTGRRIAVKEVRIGGTTRQLEQVKALQSEIKILAELDHENIIKYIGAEHVMDTLRIFLELASHGSIKDALNEFGPLEESLLRRYMFDILNGLHFLHQKGYIHRDIKPSNLLIDRERIKLADFGCSAIISLDSDGVRSEMEHATTIGTTIYMSPQVMRGTDSEYSQSKGYGRKADVWSLGISLVEMATAKTPFKNAPAAIYCVCVSKCFPTLPSHLSDCAHDFLSRCLVEDDSERASCKELLNHDFCASESMRDFMLTASTLNSGRQTSKLSLDPLSDDIIESYKYKYINNNNKSIDGNNFLGSNKDLEDLDEDFRDFQSSIRSINTSFTEDDTTINTDFMSSPRRK